MHICMDRFFLEIYLKITVLLALVVDEHLPQYGPCERLVGLIFLVELVFVVIFHARPLLTGFFRAPASQNLLTRLLGLKHVFSTYPHTSLNKA